MVRGKWTQLKLWVRSRVSRREALRQVEVLRAINDRLVQDGFKDVQRIKKLEAEAGRIRVALTGDVPGLTPAEVERLAVLAEECGEVARTIGKVLRYGWQSASPYGGRMNRELLERELGSVRAVVNLMLDAGDVRLGELQSWQRSKKLTLAKWTLYQECSISREDQLEMMAAIAAEAEPGSR